MTKMIDAADEESLTDQIWDLVNDIENRDDPLEWIRLAHEQFDLAKRMAEVDVRIGTQIQKIALEGLAVECGHDELMDRLGLLVTQLNTGLRYLMEQEPGDESGE